MSSNIYIYIYIFFLKKSQTCPHGAHAAFCWHVSNLRHPPHQLSLLKQIISTSSSTQPRVLADKKQLRSQSDSVSPFPLSLKQASMGGDTITPPSSTTGTLLSLSRVWFCGNFEMLEYVAFSLGFSREPNRVFDSVSQSWDCN
jgi:hypothetical protein